VLEHTVQQGESNLRVTFAGANVGTRWRDSLDNTFPQAGILNGQALWAGVGWLVNAILIHGAMDVLPGPVADELARHQAQKAAAIATWAIIGPLADDETGLTRTLGPETDGNLSRTFIGRPGNTERWARCSKVASVGESATAGDCRWFGSAIDIGATLGANASAAAVLQTFVHVAERTKALLVASTSGTGVISLNGHAVAVDHSYVGLEEHEIPGVSVELRAGWNRLVVKSLWHFGSGPDATAIGWASFVALFDAAEGGAMTKPLAGAVVSACGNQTPPQGWRCKTCQV